MKVIKSTQIDNYVIYTFEDGHNDFDALLEILKNTPVTVKRGRIGIKIFNYKDKKVACRQYVHGGIFRAFTKDLFFTPKRAVYELKLLFYLRELNFPAVVPLCAIREKKYFFSRLFLLTLYEEGTVNLTEFLNHADKRLRFRIIKKLAALFRSLEQASVYHPDLHLDNILIKNNSLDPGKNLKLIFVDFDKARLKKLTERDMEGMFWRLNRYSEKLQKRGLLNISMAEKILFLRTYERLSKKHVIGGMKKKLIFKNLISRIGWTLESLLYGK